MTFSRLIGLLLIAFWLFIPAGKTGAQDKKSVYKLLSSNSLSDVNQMLDKLKTNPGGSANAFRGTLMMRKAHLVKGPGQKLSEFKSGAKLLESEIDKNPGEVEFRFLRLIIQENAPRILSYSDNIEHDKEMIIKGFGKLDEDLKTEIRNYAKRSKVLPAEQLN